MDEATTPRIERALDRASEKAKEYAGNPRRAVDLISEATRKADEQQGRLSAVWDELMALFRLLRAWAGGRYQQVSGKTIVLVIAALLYFINPLDIIPDVLPAVGLLDDVTVLGFVINRVRKEIDGFLTWEKSATP